MSLAPSDLGRRQTVGVAGRMAEVLALVASGAWSMNVLSCNILVVKADDVSVVTAHVSLLVLVRALQRLQVVQLRRGVGRGRASIGCSVLGSSMDAWKLLGGLPAWTTTCRRAVHTQLLPDITHVLRRPEILEDILHVLIVVCTCTRTSAQRGLVMQSSMCSLDAHVSDAARRDEVKAELARLHELHVAEAAAVTAAHLLLARHHCSVAIHAVRVRLSVVTWVHATVLASNWPQDLVMTLSWT